MLKEITCIVCPNGCEMEVEAENGTLISVKGNLCPKGETYAKQELINPQRTISTSILIKGGELPLASVRLTKPVPKREIFHVMEEIDVYKRQTYCSVHIRLKCVIQCID